MLASLHLMSRKAPEKRGAVGGVTGLHSACLEPLPSVAGPPGDTQIRAPSPTAGPPGSTHSSPLQNLSTERRSLPHFSCSGQHPQPAPRAAAWRDPRENLQGDEASGKHGPLVDRANTQVPAPPAAHGGQLRPRGEDREKI